MQNGASFADRVPPAGEATLEREADCLDTPPPGATTQPSQPNTELIPGSTTRQSFAAAARAVTQPPDPQQIETRRRREESEGRFSKLARKFLRHLDCKGSPGNHATAATEFYVDPFNPFGNCSNTCSGIELINSSFDSAARPDYFVPAEDAPDFDFG